MLPTTERVRAYFMTHVGAQRGEACDALGLAPAELRRHLHILRHEWQGEKPAAPTAFVQALHRLAEACEQVGIR